MSKEKKQPWFLKRWCFSLLTRLDFKLFNEKATKEIPDLSAMTWLNICVFFFIMFASVLLTSLAKHELKETVLNWAIGISFTYVLVSCIIYLKNTLSAFPTIGMKVWRSVFVLLVNFFCCYLTIMAVTLAVYAVLFLLIAWIIFGVVLGGNGKSSKRKWELDNGDTVTESKGICGESYYKGDSGKSYDRNPDGTFQEK